MNHTLWLLARAVGWLALTTAAFALVQLVKLRRHHRRERIALDREERP